MPERIFLMKYTMAWGHKDGLMALHLHRNNQSSLELFRAMHRVENIQNNAAGTPQALKYAPVNLSGNPAQPQQPAPVHGDFITNSPSPVSGFSD